MTSKTKIYTDAARLDILQLLDHPDPGQHVFNRIADIARIIPHFINSIGQPSEAAAFSKAIEMSENKAPNLHEALINRAFGGEVLLREKYQELKGLHDQLRHKALDIATANDDVNRRQREVEQHAEKLRDHEKHLERERERLMLVAGERKIDLSLPALPTLDGEDEDD